MIYILDITGDGYSDIDLDMCTLYFPVPRQLGPRIEMEFWGLIIHPSDSDKYQRIQDHIEFDLTRENIFIAGYSRLVIEGPVSGELFVALYDDETDGCEFKRDQGGKVIQLARSWARVGDGLGYEYNLGGVLFWPRGDCSLDIYANGPATLEFELDDCLPISEVMADPGAYAPLEWRELE